MQKDDLRRRLRLKDDRVSQIRHILSVWKLWRWERLFCRGYPRVSHTGTTCAAVLLNYKRPFNIDLIVRSLLNTPAVRLVIISNNNPDDDMRDWLHVASGRVRVINQARKESCMVRIPLSRDHEWEDHFLWIDDDIFLRPEQLQKLIEAYLADPSVPHGIYGQKWEDGRFIGGQCGYEGSIDVISRVYVLGRQHVLECLRLAEQLGVAVGSPAWNSMFGDDILVSFSGDRRPRIHDVGEFVDCPTQGMQGVATWRSEGFHRRREELYKKLRVLKPLQPDQ